MYFIQKVFLSPHRFQPLRLYLVKKSCRSTRAGMISLWDKFRQRGAWESSAGSAGRGTSWHVGVKHGRLRWMKLSKSHREVKRLAVPSLASGGPEVLVFGCVIGRAVVYFPPSSLGRIGWHITRVLFLLHPQFSTTLGNMYFSCGYSTLPSALIHFAATQLHPHILLVIHPALNCRRQLMEIWLPGRKLLKERRKRGPPAKTVVFMRCLFISMSAFLTLRLWTLTLLLFKLQLCTCSSLGTMFF